MSTHPYQKTWDDEVVSEYITQESQEKSPEVFLDTHLPITHIEADILIGGNTGYITEQQLLNHIVQSTSDTRKNRIYMLKGEVGSGKSHLCQWLEYQLNGSGKTEPHDNKHVAIHISRNNTRLADILEKLYEHIDAEHDEVDDITAYDDYPDVVDTLLSMLGTFDADLSFNDPDFEFEAFISDDQKAPDLRDIIVENLQDYRDAVEAEAKEQKFELLTREQFGKICFNTFGRSFGGERGDDIYPDVRKAINSRLMRNIGMENFQEDLEEISQQYHDEGKRPVLICEDVTTFNVLKDDLLDHIFELGEDSGDEDDEGHGFDVVLGYTTGWEAEKADDALTTGDLDYMKTRTQGYLTMTDNNGQAFFLKQGSMPVRLVQRYLKVIKKQSDADVSPDVDEAAFDGIYPFNNRFIVRAYRHLQEEGDTQRTPRLLLYHVVADAMLSDVPPFQRAADNTHLADFAVPMSVQDLTREFQHVAKWYGQMDNGDVVVPKAICTAFDVSIPDGLTVNDGQVRLDAMYGQAGWEVDGAELEGEDPEEYVRRQESDENPTGGDPNKKPENKPERSSESGDSESDSPGDDGPSGILGSPRQEENQKEQKQRNRRIGQFQDWVGTGGEFPSSTRLTEGAQAALNKFYDPTRLGNENAETDGTAAFYYTRGTDVPITVIGPDERKSVGVDLHFADDREQLYLDLFQYGLDDEYPPDTNFARIRGWADDSVFELRQQLRRELEDCLPDDDALPSTFELEELLVLAQLFMHNARAGTGEVGRQEVLEVSDHESSSPFRNEDDEFDLPAGLTEGFTSINKRRMELKELCEGFFLLRSNFVDEERLSTAVRNVTENLDAYVDAAARVSASDLPKAYRIGTSRSNANTKVRTFFTDLSNYASELQKLATSFDATAIEEDLKEVRSLYSYDHTASDLEDLYDRLEESFGPLDSSLKADWVDVGEGLRDGSLDLNLTAFGQTLREFEDIDPNNGLEVVTLMHEYKHSRLTQDAWQVYEALGEMIQTIEDHEDAEGTQFETELRARPEFDAFQQKRKATVEALEEI